MDTGHRDLPGTLVITPDQMVPTVQAEWKHGCLCWFCPGLISKLMVVQKAPEHCLVRGLLFTEPHLLNLENL